MLGFIADFGCHEARLIIELGGWQDAGLDTNAERKRKHDATFARAGYLTVRIEYIDAVAECITAVAKDRTAKRASGAPLPLEG